MMGLMNIKSGKLEGFDVDMAMKLRSVSILMPRSVYANYFGTRVPMLNGNIDALLRRCLLHRPTKSC